MKHRQYGELRRNSHKRPIFLVLPFCVAIARATLAYRTARAYGPRLSFAKTGGDVYLASRTKRRRKNLSEAVLQRFHLGSCARAACQHMERCGMLRWVVLPPWDSSFRDSQTYGCKSSGAPSAARRHIRALTPFTEYKTGYVCISWGVS